MASVYDVPVDRDAPNNPHSFALQMIGPGRRVLEVGCAAGHVTRALHDNGCQVTGIEVDPEAAQTAGQWAENVVVGDIEDAEVWERLGDDRFEFVLFGDVLEHLKKPDDALRAACRHLEPNGSIVASIPNIGHGDVRINLLNGVFSYRDVGLLDRTHLRFFTKETLDQMFEDAGLDVVEIRRVVIPLFGTELGAQASDTTDEIVGRILADPEAETYQFVVRAVPVNVERSPHTSPRAAGESLECDGTAGAIREYLARIRDLEEALAGATAELAAIRNTKAFRLLAPARRLYVRVRRLTSST